MIGSGIPVIPLRSPSMRGVCALVRRPARVRADRGASVRRDYRPSRSRRTRRSRGSRLWSRLLPERYWRRTGAGESRAGRRSLAHCLHRSAAGRTHRARIGERASLRRGRSRRSRLRSAATLRGRRDVRWLIECHGYSLFPSCRSIASICVRPSALFAASR